MQKISARDVITYGPKITQKQYKFGHTWLHKSQLDYCFCTADRMVVLGLRPIASSPFSGDSFHGPAHQGVHVEHFVEVVDGQREDVAVGLCADAGNPPGVGQQADLAEVGTVAQACRHLAVRDDVHDALLYEVHLGADRALLDDDVA